jgi:hypothetical protein
MAGAQPRISCRSLFKQLEIPPVLCQCTLSLMNCNNNNQEIFQTDSSVHSINARNSIIVAVQMATILFLKKYIQSCHKNVLQFTTQHDNPQEWQDNI